MYHDDKAYNRSKFTALAWIHKLEEYLPDLVKEISAEYQVEGIDFQFLGLGSYNCCYRLKGMKSIIRFPLFRKSAFRNEKTVDEYLLMAYLARHTSIPLPKLLVTRSCHLGPYIIYSFVEGQRLSDFLKVGSLDYLMLQPDIDSVLLSRAYRKMATIHLRLASCRFERIGSIGQDELGNWFVKKRPVTLNMNQLVSCGNFPPQRLPKREHTFATANEYFTMLAETHMIHLETQRNDAIDDADDCRKKYVARQLFLNLARNFSKEHNHGPFPLYCDDFRPSNVLVNTDLDSEVSGVIDWEYCYAAPVEFTYCPPWWLLLAHPDDWTDGDLGVFQDQYLPRCELFLKVLREEEGNMIQAGTLSDDQRLSNHMEQSLENGHFWFCLAATSSFGFDDIYWKFIDPLHYGEFRSIDERIKLLSQEERENMERLVAMKLEQVKNTKLDEHVSDHDMFIA